MELIDERVQEFLRHTKLPFIEYYSHEGCACYKMLNPYTHYNEDKRVLCKVSEGFSLAIIIGLRFLEIQEKEFK